MKRAVITAALTLAVIAVSSGERYFPRMTEITLAEPVFIIAVDSGENSENNTKLSLVYEKIEEADEGGEGNANQKYIKTADGATAAAAMEDLKRQFPREIAVSTAEYFLIGEKAARESITKHTDYLSRNNTLRLTASAFIVRGSAYEACQVLTETKTLDILRNFGEHSGINAISSEMSFYELLSNRAGADCYTIPALVFSEEGGEKIAVPGGYAIIKDDKLIGFIEKDAARGYNIIKGKSAHSAIEIETGAENLATRLENARREISFDWDGDELKAITIDVNVISTIIDRQDADFDVSAAEKAQNNVIRSELRQNIHASKLYDCDFLNLGEALRMKHPLRWERIEAGWNEIYARTPVETNVTSRIIKY